MGAKKLISNLIYTPAGFFSGINQIKELKKTYQNGHGKPFKFYGTICTHGYNFTLVNSIIFLGVVYSPPSIVLLYSDNGTYKKRNMPLR